MAIPKLCALCCLVLQFHISQALQMCVANNGKQSQPTATLTLQPTCQPVGQTVQNIATAYHTQNAQQPIHVPIQFSQLHLQPLETSVGKVQIPISSARLCQNTPAMSLTLANPAAAPVATLVSKCNQCGQQKVQVRQQPQAVVSTIPCSGVSRNSASQITFNLAPYMQNRAVQSQPCVPCQPAPVQVSIDAGQPRCTCAPSAVAIQHSQPSYVITNQGAAPVQSSYVSLRQEVPPPYVLSAASPQQYSTKSVYMTKSPTASTQSSKTSNLKMILPLLFNLIKEKKLNCGSLSKFGNDPSIYSGFSSSDSSDDHHIVYPEEFDPYVFSGDFRDRKTSQIVSEVKETTESEQPLETTTSKTILYESKE